MCFKKLFGSGGRGIRIIRTEEKPSPGDWIDKANIIWDPGLKLLTIRNIPFDEVWIADVADTNSMDPVIDIKHNALLGKIKDHSKIQVGDICVYYPYPNQPGIMHYVHEITEDAEGRRWRFKGINNYSPDRVILRDAHVRWVLWGIAY